MKLRIIHETAYEFDSEVFYEPHYLRFKPRTMDYCLTESFDLRLSPKPAGLSDQIDPENNLVQLCWFEEMHSGLKITATSHVTVRQFNPFNFILYPSDCYKLPFTYPLSYGNLLAPALKEEDLSDQLIGYGERIKDKSDFETLQFLTELTRQIHADFILESRPTGSPYKPDRTFSEKKGSCRDLAWMEIHLLRHMGFATRFVSGYYYFPMETIEHELHAWIEVFLPGAGWVGFDPSHGILTGATHIPLAASAHHENTMPVSGTVRGNASSDLHVRLSIEPVH